MKKYIITVITIMLAIFMISSFVCKTNALGLDAIDDPEAYIKNSEPHGAVVGIGNVIVWIVRTVGEAISVLMLLIIGIKYVMGSVEERAEYKQSMGPYIIGAILIFSGSALVDVIYKAFNA